MAFEKPEWLIIWASLWTWDDLHFQQSISSFMIFTWLWLSCRWPFNPHKIHFIQLFLYLGLYLGYCIEIHVWALICSDYISLCKYYYKRFHLYIRWKLKIIFLLSKRIRPDSAKNLKLRNIINNLVWKYKMIDWDFQFKTVLRMIMAMKCWFWIFLPCWLALGIS